MSTVVVVMENGDERYFRDYGTRSPFVRYEGNFVIVVDCDEKTTAIPMHLVKEVRVDAPRRW